MTHNILNRRWILIPSFWLILAICLSPFSLSAKEIQEEQNTEKTSSSFLQQDEIGTNRPLQIQVMITASGRHNNRSVSPGAAIHMGYRFSELLYLGWTSMAFYNGSDTFDNDDDYWYDDETVYGQEGAQKTTLKIDPRHLLEMRFFPWHFGLYFSAGVMHYGNDKITTRFKSRPRIINENQYTTGMTTTLEYDEWTGAAAGIGFNHVFGNGFSLSTGLNIGMMVQEPDVTIVTDTTVAANDLAEWQDEIENNEKRVPVMFQFGVGYAF